MRLNWTHVEAAGNPAFGINYSCRQAEYLLLEGKRAPDRPAWCASTLGRVLDATGAKEIRLSVEWSQIEPSPGQYDFSLVDALLHEAANHDATVLLSVGVKAQRHPEFFIPAWVSDQVDLKAGDVISSDPVLRAKALQMIGAVVVHTRDSTAVEAWAADNEPYVTSTRTENWSLSRKFVEEEVATIRANDPLGRPVSINHAQHFVFDRRWEDALADSDALAVSIYPFRNYEILGHQFVVPILGIGPLAPNYAYQARVAHASGKPFWITEMQAEPWYNGDMRELSPANPSANLTHAGLAQNIEDARRSGADRVYLWGAEWWLYEAERFGDSSWLNQAAGAIAAHAPAVVKR